MRTYQILPISGQPDWDKIPALAVDQVLWTPDFGISMIQQICYDRENLYVRQRAWERNIRAQLTQPLSPVCQDSCMEFFFGFGQDGRYFNMEYNPLGCLYLGFGGKRETRIRLVLKDEQARFQVKPQQLADGWALTYRIPLDFLRLFYPQLTLDPGLTFRANCYKCGDLTPDPHFLAWNPSTSPTPDFHRYQDFGEMTLV